MLKWLIRRWSKEETESAMRKLNFHLSNSFMNVKKDMDSLSLGMSKYDDRFKYFEQRLNFLESQFLTFFSQLQSNPQIKPEKTPSSESRKLIPETVLSNLTYTQKNLMITLYEYEQKLNSPISIKSLAKILYPDKNLSQVRTTITEYLEVLANHNLVTKTRRRRQTYAHVTDSGLALIKKIASKEKQKVN